MAQGATGLSLVFEGAPNAFGYGLPATPEALARAHPERSAEIETARNRLCDSEGMGQLFKVIAIHSPGWPAPKFAGKYTQFDGIVFEPRPVQQPHPPIWVGGHSRAALRRTVQVGAAWHPINRPPAELRAGMAELARLSE